MTKRGCCCCCENYESEQHKTKRGATSNDDEQDETEKKFENDYEDEIDEHGSKPRGEIEQQTPPSPSEQYTPSITHGGGGEPDIISMTSMTPAHDPNGIPWITPETWTNAVWDGVPFDPNGKTPSQICEKIFPNPNTMLGLRERFYELNPFQDNSNPTPLEIENWNVEVIRHFRNLMGITTPVEKNRCLFLRAQWGEERKWGTFWDSNYPGIQNSSYGPCGGSNAHCGASFVPNETDQAVYTAPNPPPMCSATAGTEGIATTNANLPWSIKLARVMAQFICAEGMGGHAGPFYTRTKVGFSWWVMGSAVIFRGKWSG